MFIFKPFDLVVIKKAKELGQGCILKCHKGLKHNHYLVQFRVKCIWCKERYLDFEDEKNIPFTLKTDWVHTPGLIPNLYLCGLESLHSEEEASLVIGSLLRQPQDDIGTL